MTVVVFFISNMSPYLYLPPVRPLQPVVLVGWIMSTAVALTVLFAPYDSFSQTRIWHDWECALYNAFKHTAFGMSVGWVILACVSGNGSKFSPASQKTEVKSRLRLRKRK